jgi:hypothetical protein
LKRGGHIRRLTQLMRNAIRGEHLVEMGRITIDISIIEQDGSPGGLRGRVSSE